MPKFSKRSLDALQQAHPDLQSICFEAIELVDFTVICSYRGKREQNEAFSKGNSKLKFPQSKHNKLPSLAVDIVPYPLDWDDIESFKKVAKVIKKVASELSIEIEWGGDWTFKDYPHFELKGK